VDYDACVNLGKHRVVCGFSWLLRVIDHEAVLMDPKLFWSWVHRLVVLLKRRFGRQTSSWWRFSQKNDWIVQVIPQLAAGDKDHTGALYLKNSDPAAAAEVGMALFTTALGLYGGVLWSGELQGFIIHEAVPSHTPYAIRHTPYPYPMQLFHCVSSSVGVEVLPKPQRAPPGALGGVLRASPLMGRGTWDVGRKSSYNKHCFMLEGMTQSGLKTQARRPKAQGTRDMQPVVMCVRADGPGEGCCVPRACDLSRAQLRASHPARFPLPDHSMFYCYCSPTNMTLPLLRACSPVSPLCFCLKRILPIAH
jgi:hypothetical protein